jgi:O-antigen ligase
LGFGSAAAVTFAFLALFVGQIDAIAHSDFARQLAGRAALWQIAIGAYPEHPLFGFGPGSFQEAIRANLGKAHFSNPGEFAALYALQAGGFHNIWLSVLVERGLVGLAGLFVSWCLLVGHTLRFGGNLPAKQRFVVSSLLIIFFLRGQVEMAGLFDDADGPISAVVMMALALTLPTWRASPSPNGAGRAAPGPQVTR